MAGTFKEMTKSTQEGLLRTWPIIVALAALIWQGSTIAANVTTNEVLAKANAAGVRANEIAILDLRTSVAERLARIEANQELILKRIEETK